ncbi:MAG: hypothetical protein ACRC8D_07315 [Aeromonas sp.]
MAHAQAETRGGKTIITVQVTVESTTLPDAILVHLSEPETRTYHLEKSGKGEICEALVKRLARAAAPLAVQPGLVVLAPPLP